jgi:hypothetical protein
VPSLALFNQTNTLIVVALGKIKNIRDEIIKIGQANRRRMTD